MAIVAIMATAKKEHQDALLLVFQLFLELVKLAIYTVISYLTAIVKFIIPPEPKSLQNEVVLVTGGAAGIGREICLQLAGIEKCITIISWDIDDISNQNLVNELKRLGVKAAYGYHVDVSDRISVETMANKMKQEIGDVTMLFNNAGMIGEVGTSWTISPASLEKVLSTNVMAHCWTHRAFLPSMIASGYGHIVEIDSILSFSWAKFSAPYTASKFALKGYIESFKEDLRQLPQRPNIVVSLVYPDNTMTALTAPLNLEAGKYPFLLQLQTPSFVASKVINGVRRNEEHIYIPGYLRLFSMIVPLLPSDIIRRVIDICDFRLTVSK